MDSRTAQRLAAARADPDLVVLEGFHALKHALRFGAAIELAVTADRNRLAALAAELAADVAGELDALLGDVTADELARLVARPPVPDVMAVARRPVVDVDALLRDPSPRPVVLLEQPRHLGNLGACVRVAAAADAAGVLTSGTADPWHPDAVRGAAGLQFALPVARHDPPTAGDRPLYAVDPEGEPIDLGRLPPRAVLAFGTERHGLSDELLARADARIAVPMRAGVSSLNLATAVAAVLFAWRLSPAVSGAGSADRSPRSR